MAKRQAGKQLTDLNYDQSDDEEEDNNGEFAKASDSVMNNRIIKKAKRTTATEPVDGDAPKPALFAGFTGFGSSTAAKPAPESFGFLNRIKVSAAAAGSSAVAVSTAPTFPAVNGDSTSTTTTAAFKFGLQPVSLPATNGSLQSFFQPQGILKSQPTNSTADLNSEAEVSKDSPEYLAELASLNRSVSKWIGDHVAKNAHCVLSPIFSDYEKHLKRLEEKHANQAAAKPAFQFNKVNFADSISAVPVKQLISQFSTQPSPVLHGSGLLSKTTASAGFVSNTTPASTSSNSLAGFSFGGQFPKSGFFAPPTTSANSNTNNNEEDEDDDEEEMPPEPEKVDFKEDDAIHTVKCKLFYKKGGKYEPKATGFLFVKPMSGEEQKAMQLLIRADNTLGTILLNIRLSSQTPVSLLNKKNITIGCVPNPPMEAGAQGPNILLIQTKETDTTPLFTVLKACTAANGDS